MNAAVMKQMGAKANSAGSTAVVAVLSAQMIQVGNLGDSRGIIGRVDDNQGSLRVIQLTDDQTPHRYAPANALAGCKRVLHPAERKMETCASMCTEIEQVSAAGLRQLVVPNG
jgi:serine/threonine protein phosphatase PrpC